MSVGNNSRSLEKYVWIIEQLSKYYRFKFTDFLDLFYSKNAKSRDAKDNFIDGIISNPNLGLTKLVEPLKKDGSFDRDGYYTISKADFFLNTQYREDFIYDTLLDAIDQNDVLIPRGQTKEINKSVIYLFSESDKEIVSLNLREILAAIDNQQFIEFIYKNSDRIVIPLRLICYQGKWYLLASEKDEFRTYRLCRISDIVRCKKNLNKFDDNEIDEFINGSFGIGAGKTNQIATIKFYNPASDWIIEDHWHDKQKLEPKNSDDGTILMTIPYNPGFDDELIGRVTRYGGLAEIIAPEILRNKWLDRVKWTYEKYFK